MSILEPAWWYPDVETGGFDRKKHAIVEIGWALLDQNFQTITGDAICIWPEIGMEVGPEAANVNGFCKEAWEERCAVSLDEARTRLQDLLGRYAALPKIAHNAFSMDKPWIEQYFPFLSPPGSNWYCTKEMLREWYRRQGLKPGKGDLTLENLCRLAQYHRVDRHSAMEDSYAGAAGMRWLAQQGVRPV